MCAIAWQAIRHFGPNAIRNMVGLVAFTLFTGMITVLRPLQEAAWEQELRLHHSATFLIPMLVAYLIYRVGSRKLIALTNTDGTGWE